MNHSIKVEAITNAKPLNVAAAQKFIAEAKVEGERLARNLQRAAGGEVVCIAVIVKEITFMSGSSAAFYAVRCDDKYYDRENPEGVGLHQLKAVKRFVENP